MLLFCFWFWFWVWPLDWEEKLLTYFWSSLFDWIYCLSCFIRSIFSSRSFYISLRAFLSIYSIIWINSSPACIFGLFSIAYLTFDLGGKLILLEDCYPLLKLLTCRRDPFTIELSFWASIIGLLTPKYWVLGEDGTLELTRSL